MKYVLPIIEHKKNEIEQSRLIKWLNDESKPVEEKFSFIPNMTFFILGFKDILEHMYIRYPKTEIERTITTHCEEDLGHWVWFLRDLNKLGYTFNHLGEDFEQLFGYLWSDQNRDARDIVYKIMHLHWKHKSPQIDLIIIEVLEATFAAFIGPMNKNVKQAGLYSELEFFGKIHHDAEHDHSSGNWEDGKSESSIIMDDSSRLAAHSIVNELFQDFNRMFESWYLAKDSIKLGPVSFFFKPENSLQEGQPQNH